MQYMGLFSFYLWCKTTAGITVSGSGHMYVIRGYYEDTSDSTQDLYLIDPADGGYYFAHYSNFSPYWTASIYNAYV